VEDRKEFIMSDKLIIAGREFTNRLMVGTGKYATMDLMKQSLEAAEAEIVTVAVRRMNLDEPGESLLEHIDLSRYTLLPNTAGAATAEEAIRLARLARAAGLSDLIKLEVIPDPATLLPDVVGTLEAARILVKEGFTVLPYTTDDPIIAAKLEDAGAATVMPLASYIGSGRGFSDPARISLIIERAGVPVVVDAGLGVPSDAAMAMELGASAVLINTAIARAENPPLMAEAMKLGVRAGRMAFKAGRIPKLEQASASSPTGGIVK
jgi:thiazole synthase